ncbi:non-ribosomal peptide synthetase [Tropicibacter oceani]|uniref:Amino acid adenylation domain-containing protein n=1 Tax=Tropicibacter oceani TaxID=3058420 RepID=A0ABY8QH77_9RHOB|nr:non-ribosomal peptide synthetase [Tropicibacter oceani]WGW03321.1 amino acid adenylation domain-containing protein [Tropicibacter oceani]
MNSRQASIAQSEVWALDRIAPERSAAALLWAISITSPSDPAALARTLAAALAGVIARHDCLRMRFAVQGAGLCHTLVAAGPVALPMIDESALSDAQRLQAARQFGMQPYALAQDAPCRFRLVQDGPGAFRLLCGFHHIAIDGLSWRYFFRDLVQELSAAMPFDPAQDYDDFATAQRAQIAAIRAAQPYWQDIVRVTPWTLPGGGTGLASPAQGQATPAGIVETALDPQLHAALKSRAAQSGISRFRLLLTGFGAWCARAAGRDCIAVATTLAGRAPGAFDGVIGVFANVHPIAIDTQGASFTSLAASVDAGLARALDHQALSPAVALAALGLGGAHGPVPASLTRSPGRASAVIGTLRLSEERVFLPVGTRPLSVYARLDEDSITLTWVHDEALFDRDAVLRAARQLEHLLQQALADPDSSLCQIPSIPPSERARVLDMATGAPRALSPRPLHRLVQDQAQRSPDATAVLDGETRLSHAQVQAKANALALQLAALGVGRGDYVPIVMVPGAQMLLAELAVLKLGAIFVPMNPDWPALRLQQLLARLVPKTVMRRADDGLALDGGAAATLTVPEALIIAEAGRCDSVDIAPDDPVYCIFTSGSTGQPKGAINTGRGLCNRIDGMRAMIDDPRPVVLAGAGAGVDTLVWQYFLPLVAGGICTLPGVQTGGSAEAMLKRCAEAQITVMDFVPSLFAGFVECLDQMPEPDVAWALASVRNVLIGGEAMQGAPVRRFRQRFPWIRVHNSYGPTETAISCIFHEVSQHCGDPVPIGRPLRNTIALVRDAQGHPAPIGWTGELCLGGACLGLGYFDAPDLTDHSFVRVDPAALGTDRLYRTGDLARLRADGLIDYLGRLDDQISLNGNRMEPTEIEATLMQHPALAQAAVALLPSPDGPARLVAFVVIRGDHTPSGAALRDFLALRLPRGWLPSLYLKVADLPRAASGKLDRAALARCTGAPLHLRAPDSGPVPEPVQRIIDAWAKVLGHGDIRAQDNVFLDLGAESLAALQVHAVLQQALGREIDLRDLFTHATPAALAQRLAGQAPPEQGDLAARLAPYLSTWSGERKTPDSLLFTLNGAGKGRRLFWCFQGFAELRDLARHLAPHHPVTGMRSAHLAFDYSRDNVSALAKLYIREIEDLVPEGPLTIGGNCQATRIVREIAAQLHQAGREVALTILMEDTEFAPLPGRIALLYGDESHLNPYRQTSGPNPDDRFRALYEGGFVTRVIPGGHGRFFLPGNVEGLAAVLRDLLP